MTKHIPIFVILAAALALSACAPRNPEAEAAAVPAAEQWLALVDAGRFAESWGAAAPFFKNAVTEAQWVQTMEGMRVPFGKTLSRELRSSTYRTSLPGAPDGEYVVIQFNTAFEHKAEVVETITPMKDSDGVWRVSGYFLR